MLSDCGRWLLLNTFSPYQCSHKDLRLYWIERRWVTPPVRVLAEGVYRRMAVEDRAFYWPSTFSTHGLGWLYAEVFYPWNRNPSSYAHPQLWRNTPAWVIDAGACEGFFTFFALDQKVPYVLAVEPVPELASALRLTFADEIADHRVAIVSSSLGANSGRSTVNCDAKQPWEASVHSAAACSAGPTVATTTLDLLAYEHSLGVDGLIKMDVEGAEMDVLEGAAELMAACRPRLAIAVYHGHDHALLCRDIVLRANPSYSTEFRGFYGWYNPPRPYLLFAW